MLCCASVCLCDVIYQSNFDTVADLPNAVAQRALLNVAAIYTGDAGSWMVEGGALCAYLNTTDSYASVVTAEPTVSRGAWRIVLRRGPESRFYLSIGTIAMVLVNETQHCPLNSLCVTAGASGNAVFAVLATDFTAPRFALAASWTNASDLSTLRFSLDGAEIVVVPQQPNLSTRMNLGFRAFKLWCLDGQMCACIESVTIWNESTLPTTSTTRTMTTPLALTLPPIGDTQTRTRESQLSPTSPPSSKASFEQVTTASIESPTTETTMWLAVGGGGGAALLLCLMLGVAWLRKRKRDMEKSLHVPPLSVPSSPASSLVELRAHRQMFDDSSFASFCTGVSHTTYDNSICTQTPTVVVPSSRSDWWPHAATPVAYLQHVSPYAQTQPMHIMHAQASAAVPFHQTQGPMTIYDRAWPQQHQQCEYENAESPFNG